MYSQISTSSSRLGRPHLYPVSSCWNIHKRQDISSRFQSNLSSFVCFLGKRLSKMSAVLTRAVLIKAKDMKVTWRKGRLKRKSVRSQSDYRPVCAFPLQIHAVPILFSSLFFSLASSQNIVLQMEIWQRFIFQIEAHFIVHQQRQCLMKSLFQSAQCKRFSIADKTSTSSRNTFSKSWSSK